MRCISLTVLSPGVLVASALLAGPALAQSSPETAAFEAAFDRGYNLQKQGRFHEALLAYESALRWLPQAIQSPNSESLLSNLADLYSSEKRHDDAERLYGAVLQIRQKRYGPLHRSTLRTLSSLALVAFDKLDVPTATHRYAELLELQTKAFGRESPEVAETLDQQANLANAQDLPEQAVPLLLEAIRILEKVNGPQHPSLLEPVIHLALSQTNLGQFSEAERLLARSLALAGALKNDKLRSMKLTSVYLVWSEIALRSGRYAQAEGAYLALLELLRKTPGLANAQAPIALDLGSLYCQMGLLDKAEATFKQSMTLANAFGVNSPNYPILLAVALGNLYHARGNYAEAEKMLLTGRDLNLDKYGPKDPRTHAILDNLAVNYRDMGQFDLAENTARQCLEGWEARVGPEHPAVARARSNLANILIRRGKLNDARESYEGALLVQRARLAATHPDLIDTQRGLATIAARQQRWEVALPLTAEVRRNTRRNISEVLPQLAPSEQLEFLFRRDAWSLAQALSLSTARSADPAARALGAEWLLNAKGVAQQALAEATLEARTAADPRAAQTTRDLQTARRQLLRLRGKAAETSQVPPRLAKQIQDLEASERMLAAEFSRLSGLPYRADPWIELVELRRQLPPQNCFVELARTPLFPMDNSGPAIQPFHYVAWIVPPDGAGDVQYVDLGLAETIDAAAQEVRTAIEQAPIQLEQSGRPQAERAVAGPLSKLSQLVLEPWLAHAGAAVRIELSPDGNLWLVPWSALPLPDGRYAVEKFDIRYQTSGRELVAPAEPLPVGPPVVFADPNYDLTPAEATTAAQSVLRGATTRAPSGSAPSTARGLMHVSRLPGTAREAAAITPSLEQLTHARPQVYTDRWALEPVFKAVRRPRILVASTHGFFLADQGAESQAAGDSERGALPVTRSGQPLENPLARCGLLLAGCNEAAAGSRQDDGVLNGLEIVGTDLRGTELVVLSTCQTALGDIHRGEGVAGIRQAFQLAGAQAVVATLWQIDDEQTANLMSDLFAGLAAGKTKSEAIRAAQLKMIETHRGQDGSTHPYYWAPFTLTGI